MHLIAVDDQATPLVPKGALRAFVSEMAGPDAAGFLELALTSSSKIDECVLACAKADRDPPEYLQIIWSDEAGGAVLELVLPQPVGIELIGRSVEPCGEQFYFGSIYAARMDHPDLLGHEGKVREHEDIESLAAARADHIMSARLAVQSFELLAIARAAGAPARYRQCCVAETEALVEDRMPVP